MFNFVNNCYNAVSKKFNAAHSVACAPQGSISVKVIPYLVYLEKCMYQAYEYIQDGAKEFIGEINDMLEDYTNDNSDPQHNSHHRSYKYTKNASAEIDLSDWDFCNNAQEARYCIDSTDLHDQWEILGEDM